LFISVDAVTRKQKDAGLQPSAAVDDHIADLHGVVIENHSIDCSDLCIVGAVNGSPANVISLILLRKTLVAQIGVIWHKDPLMPRMKREQR
jgi:hypothetical protein